MDLVTAKRSENVEFRELAEAQKALTNAEIATEDSLRRWLDRQNNRHS